MLKYLKPLLSLLLILNIFYAFAQDTSADKKHTQMNSLVDVHWLKKHLNDKDLVILDDSVLVSINDKGDYKLLSGRKQYDKSHIPNAGFADLLGDFSTVDTQTKLDLIMPSPQQFQSAISKLGISNDSRVVIYSTKISQSWAQRLWWMLKWAGHDNMAILDGGFNAWIEAGFPVSDIPVNRVKTNYKLNLRNEIIADRDEVFDAINDKEITIIDALPEAMFDGSVSMNERPGHIKSAINIPTGLLHTESGHYKSIDELKAQFNLNPEKRIITYCGGGVAASSTAFTLHRLGYKDIAVYMGSLQEWVLDEGNPMSVED
jgi:thiosulfate/3-mercaptopyruvate sulfurtransferase